MATIKRIVLLATFLAAVHAAAQAAVPPLPAGYEKANLLYAERTYTGRIDDETESSHFILLAEAEDVLTISVTRRSGDLIPALQLLDGMGDLLMEQFSTDIAGRTATLEYRTEETSWLFVAVMRDPSSPAASGDYELVMTGASDLISTLVTIPENTASVDVSLGAIISPTPTPTPTFTAAPTQTFTPSNTPTASFTPADTNTPTDTPQATSTSTPSNTPTASFTPTDTNTPTDTPQATSTSTPSNTPTPLPPTLTPPPLPPGVSVSRPRSVQEGINYTSLWSGLDFQDISTPGIVTYDLVVDSDQSYRWVFTWCGSRTVSLSEVLAPFSIEMQVDGNVLTSVLEYSVSNCRGWMILLSDWELGRTIRLDIVYSLTDPVFDGQKTYGVGEYIQRIYATAR